MGTLTFENIERFCCWLMSEEKSEGTVTNYRRTLNRLMKWLDGEELTKESAAKWKEHLAEEGYSPVTINSMIAAINTYCCFAGLDFSIGFLKVQKRIYRDCNKELTHQEYEKLTKTALEDGNERIALLMETITATGIRVSEVKYITVEAATKRSTQISLKRKIRDIMIPGKLSKK